MEGLVPMEMVGEGGFREGWVCKGEGRRMVEMLGSNWDRPAYFWILQGQD